jgi:hypothetical protein
MSSVPRSGTTPGTHFGSVVVVCEHGDYGRIVTFVIFGGVTGLLIAPSSPRVVGVSASASTTLMPLVTLAKMT